MYYKVQFSGRRFVEFESDDRQSLTQVKMHAREVLLKKFNTIKWYECGYVLAIFAKHDSTFKWSRMVNSAKYAAKTGNLPFNENAPPKFVKNPSYQATIQKPVHVTGSRFEIGTPVAVVETVRQILILKDSKEVRFLSVLKNGTRYIKLEFTSTRAPVYYLISNFTSMLRALYKILRVIHKPVTIGCIDLNRDELMEICDWASKQQ